MSEFLEHLAFWEQNRWGITEDILIAQLSQLAGLRTQKKPLTDSRAWKTYVFENANVVKRIPKNIQEINKGIRRGVMTMVSVITGKKYE